MIRSRTLKTREEKAQAGLASFEQDAIDELSCLKIEADDDLSVLKRALELVKH